MAKKKKAKKSVIKKKRPAPKPKRKPAKKIIKVKVKAKAKIKATPAQAKAKAKAKAKAVAIKRNLLTPLAPKSPPGIPGEKFIGKVEDYFAKINVVALTLKETLAVGDIFHVIGHTTDFTEEVKSIQVNHNPIRIAKKGDPIGIKVTEKARKGDNVYRVG